MKFNVEEFKKVLKKATLNFSIDSVRLDFTKDTINSNMISERRDAVVGLNIPNDMMNLKKAEEIDIINQSDSLIYQTEKAMKDMEGKVDKSKIEPITKHVDELKELMKADPKDIDAIKKKLEEVQKFAQEAAMEMYQKAQAEQQAKAAEGGEGADAGKTGKDGETVVDAEFKEEKSDDKKESDDGAAKKEDAAEDDKKEDTEVSEGNEEVEKTSEDKKEDDKKE